MTIDGDRTSVNHNENMDSLVPGSKITDIPTGWICGQTARDFVKTKTGRGGSMDIQDSEEFQTSKFYCKASLDMDEISKNQRTMLIILSPSSIILNLQKFVNVYYMLTFCKLIKM